MKNNIIITGACRGIGKCIADTYYELGFNVIVLDILSNDLINPNYDYYQIDLKDELQIKKVFNDIYKKYSEVHILINNAAISSFKKNIKDITIKEFDDVINTNLRAYFICAKEFLRLNENCSYGRIINIASTRFHQNEKNYEAYGSSKGGVVALTNSLCISLSDTPITVNAISPGWIEVNNYDKLRTEDHLFHPSRRVGKPKDIANACVFLTNTENDFVNGCNLIIDGGMTKKMIYND